MWLACPVCRDESAFEQPPCQEGHGVDCPEWFCVTCGFAVFAGGWDMNEHATREHPIAKLSTKPAQRHHAA